MTDQLAIAKLTVHVVSSIGVTKVINDIIRNNTNIVTTVDAVKVWTGALVLGSMIGEQASNHINRRFDDVVAWNEKRKESTNVVE